MYLQFHYRLRLQVLISFWAMSGEIDSRIVLNELTHFIQCLSSSHFVLINNAEFVCLEGCITICHIAMHHVEQSINLCYNNAVSICVTFCLNEIYTIYYLLRCREIVVSTIREGCTHNVISFQFHGISILCTYINLCIWKSLQYSRMVWMFMSDQYLCDLLWLITQSLECLHISIRFLTHIERCTYFLLRSSKFSGEACIYKNDLTASINQEVLQTGTVNDLFIKILFAFFSSESKCLVHKTMVKHTNCFNFHSDCFLIDYNLFCYAFSFKFERSEERRVGKEC